MKVFENTELINFDLDRSGFTKHGQHMNAKGKELVASRIAADIKHTLKVCKKTVIIIKWKEVSSKENQGLGEARNSVGDGRDPIKNKNDSVSVENNNSSMEQVETAMKAVTRRGDFLWAITSKEKKIQGRN
jgi:hypothetical protein